MTTPTSTSTPAVLADALVDALACLLPADVVLDALAAAGGDPARLTLDEDGRLVVHETPEDADRARARPAPRAASCGLLRPRAGVRARGAGRCAYGRHRGA